ncbi:short-chain dehydrogenase [Mycena sp. CBHHK59/15]|nr:short-chain dehydrogenase [Mycena sp. CBHHK59/15]
MGHLTFFGFIKSQYSKQYPVEKVDLTGKTIIVVGANAGLGFEAAKHFATMGPGRLILACRSQSKGQAALEQLKADTACTTAELWIIDLADFASVQSFANKFNQDGGRLDILVENAAVILPQYERSKDGWETCLQVNCLSPSLLALLLFPSMVGTAQQHSTVPRIVVVASEVHYFTSIEKRVVETSDILGTLGSAEYCTPKYACPIPPTHLKLDPGCSFINILFVRALNARISKSTPLIVNAVNPGYCYSNIRKSFSGLMAVIDWLMEVTLALPTEKGSRQLVWAAVGQQSDQDRLRGEYISRLHVEEVSDYILSPEGARVQDRIWDELVEILGKVNPRVLETVDQYLSQQP